MASQPLPLDNVLPSSRDRPQRALLMAPSKSAESAQDLNSKGSNREQLTPRRDPLTGLFEQDYLGQPSGEDSAKVSTGSVGSYPGPVAAGKLLRDSQLGRKIGGQPATE